MKTDNKKEEKKVDARVVQTVRKLKSINKENNIDNNEKKLNEIPIEKRIASNSTADKTILSSNNNSNVNSHISLIKRGSNSSIPTPILNKGKNYDINQRISIDGSLRMDDSKKIVFNYDTLKKYKKKPKTDFQKNILSPNNIIKYKSEFVNLLKKDKELQNLIEKCNIINNNDDYEIYVEKFFSQPYFLYVLEMLILEDITESNTLKVFRQNKNLLPIKVVKENFFRDEVKKNLSTKISQIEYKNASEDLFKNLDQYIESIKKFEI